ncbi:hypothetical protein [Bifidobacterium cuniculi]|uniref:HEPN domain-containing protein n=1 Tax=Bifidobacterium cuniculi TaxID=1688 RepID=A0A087B504_9BIFI|nr:hypothetical protein [Bifidobacterium cuniculi]KFI66104.1 hypothetical protein BCUN_0608 [Bifidobacterium cuniculi]
MNSPDVFLEWLNDEYERYTARRYTARRYAARLSGRDWNTYDDAYTDALDTVRSVYEYFKQEGKL